MTIAAIFITGCLAGWSVRDVIRFEPSTGQRERVELVTWRTQLPHDGCPSNGCWQVSGQPRQIEAYGIDKAVWPHKCQGCGATNEIYDATWPKFEREWRAVR